MRKTATRRATTNSVIRKLQEIFPKYQEGAADLTLASGLVQRSIMLCSSDEEKLEIVEWMQGLLAKEPLFPSDWYIDGRPVSLYPLIIRTWARFGDTETLCQFILAPTDYSESDFLARWARWKCSELTYSICCEPLRFKKGSLTFIRQRCAEISSQIEPGASALSALSIEEKFRLDSIKDEISRLAKAAAQKELAHFEHSLRSSETLSLREQRAAIVNVHMRTRPDFKNETKLQALANDLDEHGIPLPDMRKKGKLVPRPGTYADVFINQKKPDIWKKHIIVALQRDLSDRPKKSKT